MKRSLENTAKLRFLLATIWFVTVFYEVVLHPRHASQALQSTSKPDRPPIQIIVYLINDWLNQT